MNKRYVNNVFVSILIELKEDKENAMLVQIEHCKYIYIYIHINKQEIFFCFN